MPMGNQIFRVLRQDEDYEEGLKAKNPNGNYQVVQHVNGTINSQYISTTASFDAAKKFVGLAKLYNERKGITQNEYIIVKIDVANMKEEKPNNRIIDLSDRKVLDKEIPPNPNSPKKGRIANARQWATMYMEVLIVGEIPASCLTKVTYSQDDPSLSKYNPDDYSGDGVEDLSDSSEMTK